MAFWAQPDDCVEVAFGRWFQVVFGHRSRKALNRAEFTYEESCERLICGSTSSLALCEQRGAHSAEDGVQKRVIAGGGDHRWVAV